MKQLLQLLLCYLVASIVPAFAQVAPGPANNSKFHLYKGDSFLNSRDWKSAINEYSIFINDEKRKKDTAEKTEKALQRKQPENSWTSPLIQLTTSRNCFNSPNNRGIVPSAFACLPKPVMTRLYDCGVKVVVAPTLPDYYLSVNKSALPDEVCHPSKGKSLDNVEGQFILGSKTVVIAENGLDAHDARNDKIHLVLHELGHAYDHCIGHASNTPIFKLFYAQDMDAMPITIRSKNEFYQEENQKGCGQVFADIFASLCIDPICQDNRSKDLAEKFPRTFKYMKEILPVVKP